MLSFKEKYGPWAIIAGSAEGLGKAWSVSLAKRKLNLVMIDHNQEPLKSLSREIEREYEVETKPLVMDLGRDDAVQKIMEFVDELPVGLLVYNAAFSMIKPFIRHTSEELETFMAVNTRTQIHLVHAFSKQLIGQKRRGGILLMSSLAGLIGMQLVAPYAATKAFGWNLAEALHHELKRYHIDIMACIAGATATPAYLKTNPKYGFFRPQVMQPETVTEAALNQLGRKILFVPGGSNRINYFILTRILPRKMAALIANRTMQKMYRDKV